jgi:dihydroorotate dehydrogenase electron transfer subunit
VAGGMGVAPLLFLAERLKKQKPLVLIGARAKELIICASEFKALGAEIKLATDDGSAGFKGRVTQLLDSLLKQSRPAILFACGPHPMLQSTAQIAVGSRIPAQLSLEAHMACGIGACLGCVVSTKNGYKSVCKDGPVFSGEEIV